MTANNNMSNAQIESAMEMTNIFTSPFAMATSFLLITLFTGFIISLIIGAIMKKQDPSKA